MWLFNKVECNVLDVIVGYACAGFLMFAIGNVAYKFGKDSNTEDRKNKPVVISKKNYEVVEEE